MNKDKLLREFVNHFNIHVESIVQDNRMLSCCACHILQVCTSSDGGFTWLCSTPNCLYDRRQQRETKESVIGKHNFQGWLPWWIRRQDVGEETKRYFNMKRYFHLVNKKKIQCFYSSRCFFCLLFNSTNDADWLRQTLQSDETELELIKQQELFYRIDDHNPNIPFQFSRCRKCFKLIGFLPKHSEIEKQFCSDCRL